jgi:hypothetical protein
MNIKDYKQYIYIYKDYNWFLTLHISLLQPFRTVFRKPSRFLLGRGLLTYLLTGLLTDLLTQRDFAAYGAATGTAYSVVLPRSPTRWIWSRGRQGRNRWSIETAICFWGDSQDRKSSPGKGPRQVDTNQTAHKDLFGISNDNFASGRSSGNLPGPHIKQQLPGKLPVSLPETLRELPELR